MTKMIEQTKDRCEVEAEVKLLLDIDRILTTQDQAVLDNAA